MSHIDYRDELDYVDDAEEERANYLADMADRERDERRIDEIARQTLPSAAVPFVDTHPSPPSRVTGPVDVNRGSF